MPLFGKKHLQKEVVPTEVKPVKKEAVKKSAPVVKAETKAKEKKAVAHEAQAANKAALRNAVIKRPRVTEKAAALAEKGIYVFEVATSANVYQIAQAIRATYKVTPAKISTARIPSKSMFVRGKRGKTVAGKKAYVHLKKGDKIELI
ncbi:MAG: 50S ribosomal protein L23 [bacterium]|nr:50S ribosomal protein L23 [bacterium]